MKLVVFAHTPPPHHGQSQMVEYLLRGLADPSHGVACFHVNARFSTDVKDNARFRPAKLLLVPRYIAQAVWLRFRHNAPNFYYIPAPPVRNALFRDWLILIPLRPFFRRRIFLWQASGLGEWVSRQPAWMRRISDLALGSPDLSIALTKFNVRDTEQFHPRRTVIVPNGVPDPCPDFAPIFEQRRARVRARQTAATRVAVRVLFLANLIKEKGFLDAIHGVAEANRRCAAENLPFEFDLTLAGAFGDDSDRRELEGALASLHHSETIRHVGFVSGEAKHKLLVDADIFCFPTYYHAENMPLSMLEAMAYGLPMISTRWRSIPEFFPPNYPGLVDPKSPQQIAAALIQLATRDDAELFRQRYLENYTLDHHITGVARACRDVSA